MCIFVVEVHRRASEMKLGNFGAHSAGRLGARAHTLVTTYVTLPHFDSGFLNSHEHLRFCCLIMLVLIVHSSFLFCHPAIHHTCHLDCFAS